MSRQRDYEVQYAVSLFLTTERGGTGHPTADELAAALRELAPRWAERNIDCQDVSVTVDYNGEQGL